jgi:ubiquinone biosynthesis protein
MAETRALTQRRRVPPISRGAHVAARAALAGGGWALRDRRRGGSESRRGLAHRLRTAAVHLGPTFIKLGQLVSAGEGIFPDELVQEFKSLRDRVPPEPFDIVQRTVEEDLGRPLHEIFRDFNEEPVAAASIAQVHLAHLATGEPVAVKVQRPGIARQVERDLAVLTWLTPILVKRVPAVSIGNPGALVDLFAETIVEELDFRLEAGNMLDIARVLDSTGQQAIVVPRPHPELVTRRVLVMERLAGFAFDEVEAMQRAGIDTTTVVRACMVAVFEGSMIFGVFHGDLHGGNLFVMPDGRVALLDYGITGRLNEKRRMALLRTLFGGMGGDPRSQLEGMRDLGAFPPDVDIDVLMTEMKLDQPPQNLAELSAETMAEDMRATVKSLLAHGGKLPKELMLFLKNMVFLDGAMATMAPDVDLVGEMTYIAEHLSSNHGDALAGATGMDLGSLDFGSALAAMGVEGEGGTMTHRDMRRARDAMNDKMREMKDLRKRK